MGSSMLPVGYRHLVAFVGFLTFALLNVQRLSTAIVIVAMVNHTYKESPLHSNTSKLEVCPRSYNSTNNLKDLRNGGEFNWNSDVQGYVLGAYFLGRIAASLPSAKLAQIFEARRVALYGCLLASVATFFAHLASRWHVYAMIFVQLLRGIGTAGMFTSFFVLMANWFPRSERGLLSTFVISGFSVGAIFATSIAGWICEHPSLGWPAVFYLTGCLGILHSVVIATTLYETPRSCPRISMEEMKYLASNEEQVATKKKSSPPWSKILTSIPIYALTIGIFGHYWTLSYFWSMQPTFLGTIQHFSITKNGYLSALPFLLKAIGEYSTSYFSHWLLRKKYASVNMLRKSCNTIGCIGISCSFLGIYYGECNVYVIAVASVLVMFFAGVTVPGALITCMDMSPRFAGSLSGMLNTIGGSSSFLVPVIVGNLTKNQTLEEWHTVFFVSIAVVMGSGLAFAFFGSAEVQPWNFVQNDIPTDISLSRVNKTRNSLQETSQTS